MNGRDVDRIIRTVRRVERSPYNLPLPGRRYPIMSGNSSFLPAKDTGGGCAAGTWSSPTSGTAKISVPTSPGSAGLTDGSVTVTYFNRWTLAVPPGAGLDLYLYFGHYYVSPFNCGAS